MPETTAAFALATLVRKKIEKHRREAKDARIHQRLSALLWLNDGHTPEQIATLLGVCSRTICNWRDLYLSKGLDALRTLEYRGDPG
jgi:transposase